MKDSAKETFITLQAGFDRKFCRGRKHAETKMREAVKKTGGVHYEQTIEFEEKPDIVLIKFVISTASEVYTEREAYEKTLKHLNFTAMGHGGFTTTEIVGDGIRPV